MRRNIRHIAQRTCVACREVRPKRELIRLVCIPGGRVEIDTDGRKAGRGAYLCRTRKCWEVGMKGSRLEHALRISLTPDNRQQLIRDGEDLLKGVN
jgi:hypothetical protein